MNELSKENYDKLNENFLYKKEPKIYNKYSIGTTPATYHCRNWTFKCHKRDGKATMIDTYWSSGDGLSFKVTDDNINDFEKIFDCTEVRRIRDSEADEYDEQDVYYAATDSGGYSCGNLNWVKKNAQRSKVKLITKTKDEISSLERRLECKKNDLKTLMTN